MFMIDATNKIPQSNYSTSRDGYKPEGIIYHITGDSNAGQALGWFENPNSQVSAHYIIEKDGLVYMCVNPYHKAYHAGKVNKPTAKIYFDKGSVNPNLYMIGIECVSSGELLTKEQHKSLIVLSKDLINMFEFPCDRYHLTGHNEFDSIDRAFDPVLSYSVDDIVKELNATSQHWAETAYKKLIDAGYVIHDKRFDDKITRGEVMALLAQKLK